MALSLAGVKTMGTARSPRNDSDPRARKLARVLVVDDEASVRTMIAAALERQGYTVEQACDGRDALDILEMNTFNLVLTDIVMNDVNGITFLERITRFSPIFLLSWSPPFTTSVWPSTPCAAALTTTSSSPLSVTSC